MECHFRVEENKDLLLFFRTLRTFSDRCDDRFRTFQHFQVSGDNSNWQHRPHTAVFHISELFVCCWYTTVSLFVTMNTED